jgi:mono/diheme cytochrome c family protein
MLKDGKLYEFTGASAPVVYRGDLFPEEFRGDSFVPEPVANLIKRNIHTEKDGEILAKHAYKETEFMAATDERFRPVGCFNGPDGALYVVDMYRGIIQHVTYVSPWYRRQVQARGLEQPRHQGRIWRIVPEGAARQPAPVLAGMSTEQLIAEIGSANGWRRDTAQRLLVERGDAAAVPALRALALKQEGSPLARLHALWTLEGMEKLDSDTATSALSDPDAKVRAAAVRLCEPFAESDDKAATLIFAMVDDPSADVALQLLLTLGEIGPKADAAMAELLNRHVESGLARSAALTGLKGRELEFLEKLLASPAWSQPSAARANVLGHLSRCVVEERKPERIARLLDLVAASPQLALSQTGGASQKPELPEAAGRASWQQIAILDGLAGAIPPVLKPDAATAGTPLPKSATAPQGAYTKGFKVKAKEEIPGLTRLMASPDPEVQKRALKFAAVITWPGKPGEKEPAKAAPLTEAQKAHIEQGKALYAVCGACHLPNGQGQEGLAPPLAGSEWVTGPEGRLIRIVLQGVGGPIEVNGKEYSLDMPGLAAALSDEQIAQILSYIRREWGHEASVVETAAVTKIRDSTKDRGASWTADELARIQ